MDLGGSTDAFNIIINVGGDANKSEDIKGLKGETWVIAPTTQDIKTYADKAEAYAAAGIDLPKDDFENLKTTCKSIKYLADASTETGAAALAVVEKADALIAQGAEKADPAAVTEAYTQAQAALKTVETGSGPIILPDESDSDKPMPVDSDSDKPTPVDSDEPAPIPGGKGDLNGDGKTSLRDASIAQKYAVGLVDLSAEQIKAGDMNDDGAVTLLDAYAIQSAVTKAFKK